MLRKQVLVTSFGHKYWSHVLVTSIGHTFVKLYMVTHNPATLGAGGVLLTTLMHSGFIPKIGEQAYEPTKLPEVAFQSGVLTKWESEESDAYSLEPFADECQFFNFTKAYKSEFCEPFAITRVQTSITNAAISRSVRCSAAYDLECILSSEIGFAVPAAFVPDHTSSSGMRELIAPKIIEEWSGESKETHDTEKFIRIHVPSDNFNTRTVRMNNTAVVEYMTKDKRMVRETLSNTDVFCVNLLRVAFSPSCWQTLDG